MKEEKLFRAIGQIDGDLVEQAAERTSEDVGENISVKKRMQWWRYVTFAASVLLVIGVAIGLGEKSDFELAQNETEKQGATTPKAPVDNSTGDVVVQDTEKQLMNFTIAFDGMGYEGIMGYEMLQQANPWEETDEITMLPIFENNTVYDLEHYAQDEWLSQERYEEMESWLLEVMTFFGMEDCPIDRNRRDCVAVNNGIKIRVDGDMALRIEFLNGLELPEIYNTTTSATLEETYGLAEYILAEYGELFAMENPQITISESDYTFAGERSHHRAYFYEKGETATETLLNYRFSYADFCLDLDGNLWFLDIVRKERNVIGEYEVISLEEATRRLLNGEYDTTYYGDTIPTEEYIRDIELTYYMSFTDDYKPYYKFWVEVPAEKQENGLNTYVAYYVPAIEGAYLDITFN